ncbi:MAG TPA: hypothetical protein VFC96_02640, partial [Anaerovoracaceae bacterium]|nr:hypothetical protein [Anaerovoracaceae bacterium]
AEVAKVINAENGVTHNYIREHYYNLWFTITAPSYKDALDIINNMQRTTCLNIIKMPAKSVYKIRVTFEMGEKSGG